MPHVIVKLYPGHSRAEKAGIAQEITKAVMASTHCAELSVSVSIEDVRPQDWLSQVYNSDILGQPDTLYKKPGYDPRNL